MKLWNGPETGDPKPILYQGGLVSKGGGRREAVVLERTTIPFGCLSYHYMQLNKISAAAVLPVLKKKSIRCFLDSGAYTHQKSTLTRKEADKIIDDYAAWIFATDFVFDFIVTFDYRQTPEVMWEATKRLEARGLYPVPVYHFGSSRTALCTIIDRGYTLIGIGGLVSAGKKHAGPFLDQVFNLTEKHGVRCHGFGVNEMIDQYPWFSVDNSSAISSAKFGRIIRKSLDPRKPFDTITVSSRRTGVLEGRVDSREDRIAINLAEMSNRKAPATPPRLRKSLF